MKHDDNSIKPTENVATADNKNLMHIAQYIKTGQSGHKDQSLLWSNGIQSIVEQWICWSKPMENGGTKVN